MDPLIKIENLSVVYDVGKANETKALADINVEIYPDEYIVFFGPSGCGKSTLLYVIAGMQVPTSGKLIIGGKEMSKASEKDLARYHQTGMGIVFQQYNLIPSLNVLDNVAIPQTFKGESRKEREPKAQALLDRFGIGAFSSRLSVELSGGQQQRVSVARALVNNTPLILADEPTGNLDSRSSQNVLDIFQELNEKDKKTIILVTHDPNQLSYAHRVFHMKDGKIIRQTINQQRAQKIDAQTKEKLTQAISETSSAVADILSVYPELTESRLKAKAVVNYLLFDLDVQQLDRLEHLVEDRILGKISRDDFYMALDDPLDKGGVGLNYQSAKQIGASVEALLDETQLIQKSIDMSEKEEQSFERAVDAVIAQLTAIASSHLNEDQSARLRDLIKKRMRGGLDRNGFYEQLDLSFSHGGVGLRAEVAHNISRRMEILLVKLKDYIE